MTDPEADLRASLGEYLRVVVPGDAADVCGVLLTGSLAAGYADEHADVDLTVVFEGAAPAPADDLGDRDLLPADATDARFSRDTWSFDWRGTHFDLVLRASDDLADGAWDPTTRWEYANAEVLADPDGRIAALLDGRLAFDPAEMASAAGKRAEAFVWTAQWDVSKACLRDQHHAAHHLASEALDSLLGLCYLAHGEFVPREKWLLPGLETLPLGGDLRANLREATLVTAFDDADVRRRVTAMKAAWIELAEPLADRGLLEDGAVRWENDEILRSDVE